MGTPRYARTILEGLIDRYEILALFTQPDKPVGRKQILTPPDTKRFLQQRGLDIPIYQPTTLKESQIQERIASLKPDFIVVAAYGQILPRAILDIAPCINLHASLLPKYRGASPIQQALLEGEKITGVTAMLMDEGLDRGDILAYEVEKIEEDDDAITLFEKLSQAAKRLTPLVLERFHTLRPLAQRDVEASYCKKIKKEDGMVEFDDAQRIWNRYRAFIQWPGIYLFSGLKLKKIDLIDKDSIHEPGKILSIGHDYVDVGCKRGALRLYRLQPPSKKEMDGASYVRGRRLGVGDTLL